MGDGACNALTYLPMSNEEESFDRTSAQRSAKATGSSGLRLVRDHEVLPLDETSTDRTGVIAEARRTAG